MVCLDIGPGARAGEDLRYRRPAGSDRRGPFAPGRLFPPTGVLANGTIARIAATGEGLPMVSGELVGRVSKGVGAPGALPDIAGVACPMPPPLPASTPWECCRRQPPAGGGRYPAAAADTWSGATTSSLCRWDFGAGVVVTAGWPPSSTDRAFRWTPSPAKSGAAESISDIEQAAGTGDFRPLARLSFA